MEEGLNTNPIICGQCLILNGNGGSPLPRMPPHTIAPLRHMIIIHQERCRRKKKALQGESNKEDTEGGVRMCYLERFKPSMTWTHYAVYLKHLCMCGHTQKRHYLPAKGPRQGIHTVSINTNRNNEVHACRGEDRHTE